jgi:hypothetical protein
MKTKTKRYLSVLLAVMVMLISSCKKEDLGTPPEIPPESSFVMDFSDFKENEDKSMLLLNDYSNYQRAVAHVFIWNIVITINLAVPVATYVHSFNYTPQYQPDEASWKWTYDVNVNNGAYTANLYGKIFETHVQWDMYISKSGMGGYSDFHWYHGISNLDNTGGEWILNHSPAIPNPYVGIVWTRNISDGVFDIRYTNIVPDGAENGGYISYGFTNDTQYNAFYEIYNKGLDNLVEIHCHRTTRDGRIKDPAFFGDENFRCWNSLLINIDCE